MIRMKIQTNFGSRPILGTGHHSFNLIFELFETLISLAGTVTTNIGLDDFDKLEMKREKLELELGIE